MELKKLKLTNIRSYSEEEISFPRGSTLLSGDIGSGKTSILLAVEYALFGLQPGQRGLSLLKNGENKGGVVLEFEVNGKKIIVERTLKRTSKSVNQDHASIIIDGVKTESSVTEIKTKVLEILNYPNEFIKKNNLLYRYTVYTPQESMKKIILEDPESRLNVLRNIFGIDKYKKIKENLAPMTLRLRTESRILSAEIKNLDENKNKLSSSKEFVNLLSEKINQKQSELGNFIKERQKIEGEISELEKKSKERDNFMKEIEKSNIMLLNKREQLNNEENILSELKQSISAENLFDEILFNETLNKINEFRREIEDTNKLIIENSGKVNSLELKKQEDLQKKNRIFKIDICPTCLQDVSETHKHNILNDTERQLIQNDQEISELKQNLEILEQKSTQARSLVKSLEDKKSRMDIIKARQKEFELAREKLEILERSKENVSKDIAFLESHIESLKKSSFEFSKFENLVKDKRNALNEAIGRERKTEIEIAELKKELEITRKDIDRLKIEIQKIEKTREKMIRIIEIENWLSNTFTDLINFTEKNIMLKLRNEFSKLFNKWFLMLTTDNFYVTLDENFTPIIMQGDFELDYENLSGGERTAVALSYRLALNQILNSILSKIKTQGLVILDEPTDGFSTQQLDKVRDILQELNVNQLVIVSHDQKIEGFVDNVIKLKKEKGVSVKA